MKKLISFIQILAMLWAIPVALYAQEEMPLSGSEEANRLVREAIECSSNVQMDRSKELVDQALELDKDNLMATMMKMSFDSVYASQNKSHFEDLLESSTNEDEQELAQVWKSTREDIWGTTRGPLKDVSATIDELSEKYQKDYIVQIQLAYFSFENEQYDQAKEIYQYLTESYKDKAAPHNMLGYIFMKEGKMDKAKKHFDKYIALAPDLANPYDSKGDYFMEEGDYKKACEMYEKAYEMDPSMEWSKEKAEKAKMKAEGKEKE
ncbi:tetratricopeptide repeat protein [Limibacter armeniacum]|uniref:tetratricopeptide repeat protein n=1 Tax=Limibacter armeniacum TaxID=466084 RepID=UPI002FE51557